MPWLPMGCAPQWCCSSWRGWWGQKWFPAPALHGMQAEVWNGGASKASLLSAGLIHHAKDGAPREKPEKPNRAWKASGLRTHL